MPPMRRKSDLPSKTCPVCQRPFTWRKKWERDWENVKFCSRACSANAGGKGQAGLPRSSQSA